MEIRAGSFSTRLAIALQTITSTNSLTREWTQGGWHPAVGFIPKPRKLKAKEKKLYDAALKYLRRLFVTDVTKLSAEEIRSMRVTDWLMAANMYVQHYQGMTTQFDEDDIATTEYDQQEYPPHIEPRIPSKLETQVFDAALDLLTRSFDMPTKHEYTMVTPSVPVGTIESSI